MFGSLRERGEREKGERRSGRGGRESRKAKRVRVNEIEEGEEYTMPRLPWCRGFIIIPASLWRGIAHLQSWRTVGANILARASINMR